MPATSVTERTWTHSLTVPPPSLANQAAAVGQGSEAGAHTGFFVLGGNPVAPMACLKGPLSQHQGGLPGARPSWETWHVGGFLATLPTGHSESTQELGPLNEPKEAEARARGSSAVQIGLES